MSAPYLELLKLLRQIATLSSVVELLGWDQETMMPPKAANFRAEELALASRLTHQQATSPRIGELLAACEVDDALLADEEAAANVREIRRDYDRARKLPDDLVAELSETSSRALEAWKQAREQSSFKHFLPWLERLLALTRTKAECYGSPTGQLYDALLEDYEPGATSAELQRLFGGLREELVPLIQAVASARRKPDTTLLDIRLPIERQRTLCLRVLERIGFDGKAGRLDTSAHPFSSGLAPGDTRITTRFREDNFYDALSSTLHEAGHALYEQGLPKEARHGQPLAEPLGLGIHESQSRLWENHIGRSRPFCTWLSGELRTVFGADVAPIPPGDLYGAVNAVRPNLIRIESDETTYNLHIMLRFDLERAMLAGDLRPVDVPAAWNDRVKADLGLEVPDDARGCLQDIHWSLGAFGYFPSYTMGNLYAALFWEALVASVPDVSLQVASGEFADVLGWLRREIHALGRRVPAAELCRRISGGALTHEPLLRHLTAKLREVYELDVRPRAGA